MIDQGADDRRPGGPAGVDAVDEVHRSAQLFGAWAEGAFRRLPLYHHLCLSVSRDREVAGRLLLAHPDQRIPNLLLAAVHDVVLAGEGDPLHEWYGSAVPEPRRVGRGADDPWPHFRRLVLEHDGVAERLRTRATQTNEVGRCATLVPALAEVARHGAGEPGGSHRLGLVELGASGGLNLLLDHYGYRYVAGPGGASTGGRGGPVVAEVNPSAALVLTCSLRGDGRPPVPDQVPAIVSRVGVDLDPVDVGDRDQARWLVACQWPEQPDRVHRARTAIALAHGHRPRVVRGDAVDQVGSLVDAVPAEALPVVIATWVLSYLPIARQRALVDELDRLGRARDLSVVFSEQPQRVPGLPVPPRPDGCPDGDATALVRLDWRHGRRTERRLADQHPHGAWLEWFAD